MNDQPLPQPFDPTPKTRGVTLNWMAPFYDRVCRAMGLGPAFRERTVGIAALRPGESVLDVGCGTGVLTQRAARAVGPAGTVWGIDPAPDMIRVALRNAAAEDSPARFKPGIIEEIAFESESFDAAFAAGPEAGRPAGRGRSRPTPPPALVAAPMAASLSRRTFG